MLAQAFDVNVGLDWKGKFVGDVQHRDAVENGVIGPDSRIEGFCC